MGFRFQKRVSLFPGVRLNFSARGISATLGVRGASVNLGNRGTYLNLGIPGSGISYRTRINPPPSPRHAQTRLPETASPQEPARPFKPSHEVRFDNPGEIRSAPVNTITSDGLSELKRLINEATSRRREIEREIATAASHVADTERKLANAQRFLVRIFTRKKTPILVETVRAERQMLRELNNDLAKCVINLDTNFDEQTANAYAALARSYDKLRHCHSIWDITSSVGTDQIKERTNASEKVNRTKVALDFAQSKIINISQPALRFCNVNGDDIYIYPGFALVQSRASEFALIEMKDFSIKLEVTRFFEEEAVPSDCQTIGATWKMANKDGTPDRRFSGNYQIPVVRYGQLWIASSTGLHEAYMFSDAGKAEDFAKSFASYRDQLAEFSRRSGQNPAQADDLPEDIAQDPSAEFEDLNVALVSRPRFIAFDWLVLIGLLVTCGVAVATGYDKSQSMDFKKLAASWFPTRDAQQLPMSVKPAPQVEGLPSARVTTSNPTPRNPAAISPPTATRPNSTHSAEEFSYVQRPSVNVRSTPSVQAPIVTSATKSTRFKVFRRDGEWAQVGDNTPVGWIRSDLLGPSAP